GGRLHGGRSREGWLDAGRVGGGGGTAAGAWSRPASGRDGTDHRGLTSRVRPDVWGAPLRPDTQRGRRGDHRLRTDHHPGRDQHHPGRWPCRPVHPRPPRLVKLSTAKSGEYTAKPGEGVSVNANSPPPSRSAKSREYPAKPGEGVS